jgi:hypothetical protein
MEEGDNSAAATAIAKLQCRDGRGKNKAGDERERKGNSSKKVKTNFTFSPRCQVCFYLAP